MPTCGTRSLYLAGARLVHRSSGSDKWVSTSITLMSAIVSLSRSGATVSMLSLPLSDVIRVAEGRDWSASPAPAMLDLCALILDDARSFTGENARTRERSVDLGLAGKTVIVTGGSGAIGQGLVLEFAREGA